MKPLQKAKGKLPLKDERYNTLRHHSSLGYRTPAQAYKESLEMREVSLVMTPEVPEGKCLD
jgi:hypothetical protein